MTVWTVMTAPNSPLTFTDMNSEKFNYLARAGKEKLFLTFRFCQWIILEFCPCVKFAFITAGPLAQELLYHKIV